MRIDDAIGSLSLNLSPTSLSNFIHIPPKINIKKPQSDNQLRANIHSPWYHLTSVFPHSLYPVTEFPVIFTGIPRVFVPNHSSKTGSISPDSGLHQPPSLYNHKKYLLLLIKAIDYSITNNIYHKK